MWSPLVFHVIFGAFQELKRVLCNRRAATANELKYQNAPRWTKEFNLKSQLSLV